MPILIREIDDKNRPGLGLYKCDCGTEFKTDKYKIKHGHTQSCGCLQKKRASESAKVKAVTHNKSYSREYTSYWAAHTRCNNSNHHNYFNYGGRGIEFRFKSFEDFYKEIGDRPENTTLDRINNEGHYEIGNVRWATTSQQACNRRARHYLPYKCD